MVSTDVSMLRHPTCSPSPKYDGLDPEVLNGYDNEMYPRPLSFIVGLNLNF